MTGKNGVIAGNQRGATQASAADGGELGLNSGRALMTGADVPPPPSD